MPGKETSSCAGPCRGRGYAAGEDLAGEEARCWEDLAQEETAVMRRNAKSAGEKLCGGNNSCHGGRSVEVPEEEENTPANIPEGKKTEIMFLRIVLRKKVRTAPSRRKPASIPLGPDSLLSQQEWRSYPRCSPLSLSTTSPCR